MHYTHPVAWKRHDLRGIETCHIGALDTGWRLEGVAVLLYEAKPCRLDYLIDCSPQWVTRSALVTGWVGDQSIDVTAVRDASGHWLLNGNACEAVSGCIDIDLNFSPSTNLLPIRRLEPELGGTVSVRAAWLRFPGFELEPLEQSYTRLAENTYRYESGNGRFVADVTVDDDGLVVDYGNIWSREAGI